MTDTKPALVEVQPQTVERYMEAHRELEDRLGTSPGPEFLMSLAVEKEDPMELIDEFTAVIVQALRNQ